MATPNRPSSHAQGINSSSSRSRPGYRKRLSQYSKPGHSAKRHDQQNGGKSLDRSFYSAPNAGRYRDGASPARKSNARSQSRRHAPTRSLNDWNETWQSAFQTLRITAHHMVFGLFWGAVSAGVGFWLTYWSPLSQPIQKICQLLNEASLPLKIVLQPEILVLSIAGIGIIYSLTYTCSHDWRNPAQYSNLIAGLSAVLAGLITQWVLADSLAQNLARFAALLALGATISLGIYNLLYISVIFLGTYLTFWGVMHFHYWEPSHLGHLFDPAVGIPASSATCAELIVLFSLVGLIVGFWNIAAQKFALSLFQSHVAS